MLLNAYNTFLALLGFFVFRICLRAILALRFHFRFGHIGFFSINNVQYHHHKSSEAALWSVQVGKLKLRLRNRLSLSAPTPYITIYIADVHIQLHSLTALAAARQLQKKSKRTSQHRLSRVSSSLKEIPWLYSLSIVKQAIKFTSALPAQLLMSGLANYVDVQFDKLTIDIEDQASTKIDSIAFRSILFADVSVAPCKNSDTIPASPLEQEDYGRLSSVRSSYQRHSLKRAQHLFKEKFFEIMVDVGNIVVVGRENLDYMEEVPEWMDILKLPSGGSIVISCHLSAACVTLKDVDVNIKLDTISVQSNRLIELADSIKALNLKSPSKRSSSPEATASSSSSPSFSYKEHDITPSPPKNSMTQFFRSFTLSVDSTSFETQHQSAYSSELQVKGLQVSGIASECYVNPYYKLQCVLETWWTIKDTSQPITHSGLRLIHAPEIKFTANMAQSLVVPSSASLKFATDLDVLPDSFEDSNTPTWSDDLRPNKSFVDVTLSVREPKICLDVSKTDLLNHLEIVRKRPRSRPKANDTSSSDTTETILGQTEKIAYNLPRGSLSLCIDKPSIRIKCAITDHMGIMTWSGITFEMNGIYSAQKNRPASLLPRYSEKVVSNSNTEDHIEFQANSSAVHRIQTQSRPSWMNLFRRSWRSRGESNEAVEKKTIEWYYKTSMRFTVQNTCFDVFPHNTPKLPKNHPPDIGDPNYFISVGNFECNAHTQLDVSFLHDINRQNIQIRWDPDSHHINVDTVVDQPMLNLWTKTADGQQQMDFWVKNVANQLLERLKSSKRKGSDKEQSDREASDKGSKDELLRILSIVKSSTMITDGAIVFEGIDHGLKGKRAVPDGYLDNAPEKDIDVRVVASIQQITFVFSGARIFATAREDSNEHQHQKQEEKRQHIPFGTARLSIQHIFVERIFKSDNSMDEYDWHQHEDRKVVIMWISRINVRTEILLDASRILLLPSIVMKKNGIQYSITNHYACLVTAVSTLNTIKELFPKKNNKQTTKNKQSKLVLYKMQFQINRTDMHVFLPGTTEIYMRMDTLRMEWDNQAEHQGEMPPMAIRNFTIYGVSPNADDQWDQLFEMDNMRFSIKKDIDFATGDLIKTNELAMSKLYMRIPYGYELSNFVDSAVSLTKAIKTTHARISKGVSFLYFGPKEKKTPTVIPHMRLICDLFTFQFEDDPFEARLRLIWKTGIVEQASRNAIQEAFEAKAQALMNANGDIKDGESTFTTEETDARVNEAWQGLQEHNSNSWKRHIDTALAREAEMYTRLQSSNYRHTMVSSQLDEVFDDNNQDSEKLRYMSDMFCIKIVDLPKYPPLLDMTMKHTSLSFRQPDFALDETRQFVYDVGKGQPIDKPLSTIIPFHLDWKSSETWAQIRDYPVPFISVPPLESDTEDDNLDLDGRPHPKSAWTLSGNYVFGDDLGDLDATRSIHLPIVNENHASYAIDIVRTSTPLKFFSIVNIDVHNSALSHICWCVPYQPAIQDITRVMDTFTKPSVDPSDKIGFWDKIRLIIHTRVKISFVGGGDLAMVMKGSRDPYDMSEKGFGLAKVWRNDVVWLLGHKNPQGEFMQIISKDYAFGVPDLMEGGYRAPYIVQADRPLKEYHNQQQQQQQQQQQVRQSISLSSFNSSLMSNNKESGSRFVKIALKLTGGIRMGLGCHLERMCNPNCEICDEDNSDILHEVREIHKSRLLLFKPHYKVKLKAPQNVHEENYDAYRGFRSDFIHSSISIIKLTDGNSDSEKVSVTGNSMHLTPGFMTHYVNWFRLFGGAMGYPLRAGSLFPKADTRPTKKFGRHMSTMKYKVVVNPLTVGFLIKDENVVADDVTTEELGESVGLKAFVKEFSIDIHQRREIVNVADYKLDQKRLKANWPINEAEVQLKNTDLRAIRASYTMDDSFSTSGRENVSVPVSASQDFLSDESDNGLNMMEGLNYKCNNDSDSSDWVDLDDFIEMGVATPDILPAIQVLPFAFTPCIYYLRQNNRDDIQKYKYLHDTHACILGTAVDTREMQMTLLHDRRKNIDIQIRKHQTRLHNIELKRLQHGSDEKTLQELSDTIVEKTRILYEKRELLQRYLKDLSTQDMPNVVHNDKPDAYSTSTIFGKDSLAQWEELMGHFKIRYIAHNPQILWNNSVRNILYRGMDLRDHRRALSYYMTARTVKFLRDLIEASDVQYSHNHKQFVLDDDEGGMDSAMAEELIAKLLSEQDTKFYAQNETEEASPMDGISSNEVDMSRSENVNNPHMQLKTIPSNYVMKSSYLVDLLNPQISLQSDNDPDSIVLVANERTQVKGFNIIDETDPDAEMELVKHRTVVSLDNVQFFVAKKEQFDSVDLLLDNHYGAKESDHWLAWIPPEMLISYVKRSDKFQRIGERIAATLQYDKYNPLRIKANASLFSEVHPFEDRSDTVQLNFPSLKLSPDSSQYNAIYQVATDLLLYKEPAKKERLARLREIMMAADRSSLFEATEKIVDLQSRSRQLIHARDQYQQNMALLDEKRLEEFKSIRLTLHDTLEELYLGMEAIKLMQSNQRKDFHEPKTNLKFVVCAERMEWDMLTKDDVPLCECILTNFTFNFVSKEDHSSINTLEIDIVQVRNLSPSPMFTDVLGPYFDSRKPYDFSRHKMLRCYFVSLAPVGGIPVIQHLEINLHPMRVQMTYNFGRQLALYLFPPEKPSPKQVEPIQPTPVPAPNVSNSGTVQVPSSPPDSDSSMDHATSSSIAVPQPSSSERTDNTSSKPSSLVPNASASVATSIGSLDSQKLNVNGNINNNSLHTLVKDDIIEDSNNSPASSASLSVNSTSKKQKKQKVSKYKAPDDLSVMKKRASSNRAFILVKIPGARHCLSYQGPREKNIEDLRDFAFEQPTLEFRNETWSWFELMSNIKKDFMKAALLHNSTALLKEKLLRRHAREPTKLLIEPSVNQHSTSAPVSDHQHPPGEVKMLNKAFEPDNHSDSSLEDLLDSRDIQSLHSGHSQENWDAEEATSSTKKPHIWQKLKKSKKTQNVDNRRFVPDSLQSNDQADSSSRSIAGEHPPAMVRSFSASTRHLHDGDQLSIKGKYLLGKYYNGPTQWLAPGSSSAKLKGKQSTKKI